MNTIITLVTANLLKYGGSPGSQELARFAEVERMLRTIDADVLAVQEIMAGAPPFAPGAPGERAAAEQSLHQIADAIDRRCAVADEPVLALGGDRHHTALLWRKDIDVVPGTVARYGRSPDGMWHSMVTAVFDLGGPVLRVGSAHLSHYDPGLSWGWHDAGQVMRAMNRRDRIPGLVGGDWNALGASEEYDPNPYTDDVPWHPDHAFHFDHEDKPDRHAAVRLELHGRFRDCARILGVDWAPTTGRHPTDNQPPRRLDRWYANRDFPDTAVSGFHVLAAETVGECTDHDPVVLQVDPAALAPATRTRLGYPILDNIRTEN
ncbi:endonuclease/exonuclease/phosphatase family protein [Amycolatopsis saalfeldensis]|uniref:Endonuclease/exonuclease/phosphatase domain-containing protein n=1 Tax=Amycolatopsis saalfeldensis TaxID=394193 RepID=A0A1H8YP33_9PSEU|nr:endonuclease/exonuclease/phosphatase family protein [Amycolatopsis saalfeldensis]SEP53751.1 hypothetical protein SAMN04489732_13053 [Amycolatopsis saalfeldensis]